jgi:hypothetical protein
VRTCNHHYVSEDSASIDIDMLPLWLCLAIAAGETSTVCKVQIAVLGPRRCRFETTLDCSPA